VRRLRPEEDASRAGGWGGPAKSGGFWLLTKPRRSVGDRPCREARSLEEVPRPALLRGMNLVRGQLCEKRIDPPSSTALRSRYCATQSILDTAGARCSRPLGR